MDIWWGVSGICRTSILWVLVSEACSTLQHLKKEKCLCFTGVNDDGDTNGSRLERLGINMVSKVLNLSGHGCFL